MGNYFSTCDSPKIEEGSKGNVTVPVLSCPAIMIKWASCTKRAMDFSESGRSLWRRAWKTVSFPASLSLEF